MINLNKIVKLGCIALLTTVLLAGCAGRSDNSKANSSSKSKSEKLARESSKRKEESKRKASESKKKAESKKATSESAKAESDAQVASEQTSSQVQQSSEQTQQTAPVQSQPKTQSQINMEHGYDSKDNPVVPGQDHAPGTDVYGNSDSWVQGQVEWAKQNGYLNQDGTPTEKGQQADAEVEANANSDDADNPNGAY